MMPDTSRHDRRDTATSASEAWLRCFLPRPQADTRLICFPHAGGAASFYRNWAARLPPAVELLAVQYPGREDRFGEPQPTDLGVLADAAAAAVGTALDKPIALFGHSMGAAVAYEVARRLEGRGTRPAMLFVSGRPAPHASRVCDNHRRDDDELVAALHRLGAANAEALDDPHLRSLMLPVVRADLYMIENYRPVPGCAPLECPVTAIIGDVDPEVTQQEADAWRACTRGPFSMRILPGGHFYLVDRCAELIAELTRRLGATRPTVSWPSTP